MQDGRLLLLRRNIEPWLGWWDIPGGFCDAEEHPMDTAAREAQEETGIAVEVTGFLGLWLDRYPSPDDPDHVVTLNAYYHATAGAAVGDPDPHETAEAGLFRGIGQRRRSRQCKAVEAERKGRDGTHQRGVPQAGLPRRPR